MKARRSSRRRRLALAISVCFAAPGTAQVSTDYRDDAAPLMQDDTTPDTTGLWYHIEQHQPELANQTYQRLRARHPGWQPAAELLAALNQLNQPAAEPMSAAPTQAAPSAFERLAELSVIQRRQAPAALIRQAQAQADEQQQPEQHLLLGWTLHSRQSYPAALDAFAAAAHTGQPQAAATGRAAVIDSWLHQALEQRDTTTLHRLLALPERMLVAERIDGAGWQALEDQDYPLAEQYFELAGDTYGQALSLRRQGKNEAAATLACASQQSLPLATLCADIYAERQLLAYEQARYADSLAAADKVATQRPLTTSEQELVGWAAYQLPDPERARQALAAVLKSQPNREDIAQALWAITPEAGQHKLASRFDAVVKLRQQQTSRAAWQRQQFVLAKADQHPRAPQPDNAFTVYTGVHSLQRSGEAGQGNLDILNGYVGISDTQQRWQWDVRLDYEQVYSGAVPAQRWFGRGQTEDTFTGITGLEDTGMHASVMHQQANTNVYAEINYRLFDQPAPSRWTGQLGGSWFGDNHLLALTAYRERMADSMLSLTGTFFERPASDETGPTEAWGGVLANGLRSLYVYNLGERWAAAVSLDQAWLDGLLVEDNQRSRVRLDLSHSVDVSASEVLDYWRIGPYISWGRFSHNAAGFTQSQGGYFSPQRALGGGLYTEVLTHQAQRWQLKARLNLGYNHLREDSVARFAGQADSPVLAGQTQAGLGGQLGVEGQYLITPRLSVAAFIQQDFAVDYRATWGGVQLRWQAGRARGLTSDRLILSDPALRGFAL